jgi:aquaporin Z
MKGIALEATMTFFLVFAYFGTLVDERGPGRSTGGLIVGLVVVFNVLAFAPYTGAAMNPARWFGPAFAAGVWTDWYVWVVGPVVGGGLAALVYGYAFLGNRGVARP